MDVDWKIQNKRKPDIIVTIDVFIIYELRNLWIDIKNNGETMIKSRFCYLLWLYGFIVLIIYYESCWKMKKNRNAFINTNITDRYLFDNVCARSPIHVFPAFFVIVVLLNLETDSFFLSSTSLSIRVLFFISSAMIFSAKTTCLLSRSCVLLLLLLLVFFFYWSIESDDKKRNKKNAKPINNDDGSTKKSVK